MSASLPNQYRSEAPIAWRVAKQLAGSALVASILVIATVDLTAAPAHANRLDCTGYPETRQFVDAQSWWRRSPGKSGTDFGHVHLGGCIPEREQHSSAITLDIRLVMHANPGIMAEAVLVTKTASSEVTRIHDESLAGFTCPVGTCERWVQWNVPLEWFDHSGLQEIRYRAYVDEPDGNRMIVSLNFQTYINNGRPASDVTRNPYLRGKGWYTGAGYCEASLREPLPDRPVHSRYGPPIAMVDHDEPGDLPITHAVALLDADFHNDIPGMTLAEASASLGPQKVQVGRKAITGEHRLLLKADCDDPRGSTNSGVLVYLFSRH
jgi:hypothetical protein